MLPSKGILDVGEAMILFGLKCGREHEFEGWFPSGEAYEAQLAARELSCPMCGDRRVEKAVMAPRIGKAAEAPSKPTREAMDMRKALVALREKVEANCDYVGPAFAEEARRIHYGEVEGRGIYGETSDNEARSLHDEGIPVAKIPWVPRHDG